MIVVDTSLLYALLDRGDRRHGEAGSWYRTADEELATTPLIVAEMDYLARRRSAAGAAALRRDLAAGAYFVAWWPRAEVEIAQIAERYTDLGLSLADASLVALADRIETTSIGTFDERHFRAVRPLKGGPAFTLLPIDR